MAQFQYSARTRTGEKRDGSVEASDRRAALAQVERLGLVPVSLKEGGALAGPAAKKKTRAKKKAAPSAGGKKAPKKANAGSRFRLERRGNRRPRMNQREVLFFSRELSDLLASGMKLGNALNTLAQRETGKERDQLIAELRDEIIQGGSLSDSLARRPETFSPLYVSLVRAGEAGGALAESLESVCRHQERVSEAREKVAMALTYPSIVLIFGTVTIIFSMIFVVPRFTSIFDELGSTLPLPTRMLIGLSDILIKYGWALLIAAVLGVIAFRRYIRTEPGRWMWHRALLRMPVVKSIVTANAYAHFARTLGALLNNGVPVLKALSIVEDTVGNAVIANEIREARERVTDGATISGPLAEGDIFPQLLTDMLAVGEETGDMSGALAHIARRYDNELDRSVKVLTTVLEPILILFIAALVGFVAISMLLAVFDLTSGLGG